MEKENRDTLIAIAIIVMSFLGVYAGIGLYSGHDPQFSVVTSQSMQHNDKESMLGVIDTGDMVLVRDKSKVDIQTYIQGYETGYTSFGDYGNVIIYKTESGRNIIHRVFLFLEVKEDGFGKYASIPYLENYPSWGSSDGLESVLDPQMLREDISIKTVGYRSVNVHINIEFILNNTETGTSGYITMGDNNSVIDQNYGFTISKLVTDEMVVSIPMIEMPWIGCFKLVLSGKGSVVDSHVPNSIPDLGIVILTVFLLIVSLYVLKIENTIRKRLKK